MRMRTECMQGCGYKFEKEKKNMKKVLCAVIIAILMFSNGVAESANLNCEEILDGTWATMMSEWNRDGLPGTFSYPSDSILLTYSPSGATYIHFYRIYEEDKIEKSEKVYTYELSFAVDGNVIAINDNYGSSIIYEKIEEGSIFGGNWYADYYIDHYRDDSIGHINLYGITLSFSIDGNALMTLTLGNPRYEGYNEEEITAVWTLEENVLTLQTYMEGFENLQGSFDGSVIDFSGSVSDLYFYRK